MPRTRDRKDIDWGKITDALPYEKRNQAHKAQRKKMWKEGFDPNGNGYASLAECEKGIRDCIKSDALFDAKPAIMRSFAFAKAASPGDETEAKYLEWVEFRLFLQTLRQYFEYWQVR